MLNQLIQDILKTPIIEWIGFIFSLTYLILATKEKISCWVFAIASSAIYVYLFFNSNLYIDSALQSFYIIMAFVGWVNWKKSSLVRIKFWSLKSHFILIALNLVFAFIIGFVFEKYTDQAYPYIDALIFCFSISATYLITLKIIENWIYFVIIDFIALFIYWQRDLKLTSVLFGIYTILALVGYFAWLKEFKKQKA